MALNLSYSTKDSFYTTTGNAIKINQPNNMSIIPSNDMPNNMSVDSPITSVNIMPRLSNLVHPESLPMSRIGEAVLPTAGNVSYENMQQLVSPLDTSLQKISDLQLQQNQYLQKAQEQQAKANTLKMAAASMQTVDAYFNYRSVKNSKAQYETQKKILDTNLANTESALENQLRENMADLDVISAAKNVDLSSQGITASKEKAAEDVGKDISQMRTQNELQKAALDLQYKMNKEQAKSNLVSSVVNTGITIASLL